MQRDVTGGGDEVPVIVAAAVALASLTVLVNGQPAFVDIKTGIYIVAIISAASFTFLSDTSTLIVFSDSYIGRRAILRSTISAFRSPRSISQDNLSVNASGVQTSETDFR